MKKSFIIFFIILFFPCNILAYSNFVIPGGESVGIDIKSDGLVVVGFYKVDDEYIGKSSLKIGDSIIKINNTNVYTIKDLTSLINDNDINNNSVNITIVRNGSVIDTTMNIKEEGGKYKTGLYIKDSIIGIGTLTYIDPVTKIYGSLGHEILFSESNSKIEVKNGNLLSSKVNSIDRSMNGKVGSKNATINYNKILGTISKNTDTGIYGMYTSELPNKSVVEISDFNDIKSGSAQIYTVTKKNAVKVYNINIIDKYNNKRDTSKAFSFEIIDEELLKETGGIVQGMSGSPIFQNDRIIGAVTNVLVDNVALGYGICIKTMLSEGEK